MGGWTAAQMLRSPIQRIIPAESIGHPDVIHWRGCFGRVQCAHGEVYFSGPFMMSVGHRRAAMLAKPALDAWR